MPTPFVPRPKLNIVRLESPEPLQLYLSEQAEQRHSAEDCLSFHLELARHLLSITVATHQVVATQRWQIFAHLKKILPLLESRRRWEYQCCVQYAHSIALPLAPIPLKPIQLDCAKSVVLQYTHQLGEDYLLYTLKASGYKWLSGDQHVPFAGTLLTHTSRVRQDTWFLQSALKRLQLFLGEAEGVEAMTR